MLKNGMRLAALAALSFLCGIAWGQVSPFTDVRFEEDDSVHVEFNGAWVELVSIGGVATEDLVEGSKLAFEEKWKQRIGEDLLDLFDAMGVELADETKIDFQYRSGDEITAVTDAPMTRANRQMILKRNNGELVWVDMAGTREQLEGLVEVIASRHAYATLRGLDLGALIETELALLGAEATVAEIRRSAHRVVCLLGDGHARVREWNEGLPSGNLPVRFKRVRGGIAVYWANGSGLVDASHPYIESIDGVDIAKWIEAMSSYVAAGSEQLVERRSLSLVGALNFARGELGLEASGIARLTVRDAHGTSHKNIEVNLLDRRAPRPADWRRKTGMIDGDIGYLRLDRMFPERGVEEEAWRQDLRAQLTSVTEDASGLVIDVRGNGGGWRDPILALMPSLMDIDDQPIVVNTARYRLEDGDDPSDADGYLGNRYLYPQAWDGWSNQEREAIDRFAVSFEPAWDAPEGQFSDWHYMVVSPGDAELARFGGPVVVLMDEECFSATDIFVAALGELANVTLMGTTSGGGSARSERYNKGALQIQLASMVSYQPNGQLYDGVGVAVDVEIEPDPEDLDGRSDRQLDHAVKLIRTHNSTLP